VRSRKQADVALPAKRRSAIGDRRPCQQSARRDSDLRPLGVGSVV